MVSVMNTRENMPKFTIYFARYYSDLCNFWLRFGMQC
jgi:hypothetical protein